MRFAIKYGRAIFLLMALSMFAAIPTETGTPARTERGSRMNRRERRREVGSLQRRGVVPGSTTTRSIAEQRLHAVTEGRSMGSRDNATGIVTFTPDERRQAREHLSEAQDLREQAEDAQLSDNLRHEDDLLSERQDRAISGDNRDPESGERISRSVSEVFGSQARPTDVGQEDAFRYALLNGLTAARSIPAHAEAFQRALDTSTDPKGGYLVAPQQFIADLLKAVDNEVFVRRFATVSRVNTSDSIGRPSMDSRFSNPSWTAEIQAAPEDATTPFGKRELKPNALSKLVKVSNKLLNSSVVPVDGLIRNELKYVVGITEENAFMNGTGAAQPLGMFVASTDGISTSRDVSTDNTTAAITFKNLKRNKYSVKAQYWPRSRWVFHRDIALEIALIQDTTGQFIWEENVKDTEGPRLLASPVSLSEYAPNTIAASTYVGLYGDLSNYWIADSLNIQIQVLDQLYALTNQTGYIVRKETDGGPVLEESFSRVQMAAS